MSTILEPQEKYARLEEEFKDFLEWLNTVPEPSRRNEPIEMLYIVYAHERKTGAV